MTKSKLILVIGILAVALISAGCQQNKTRVAEGAVIGGVLGAAAGGIIGHQGHHGGEGAGIGAAAGILTGALIGAQMKKAPTGDNQTSGQVGTQNANSAQMSVLQVVELSKQGINEDVIIDKIRITNSKFTLSPEDLDYLKKEGVSQKIINVMQGL
jgi:hypothetical protein